MDLAALLETLPCDDGYVFLLGDFNAQVGSLAPDLPDQPSRSSCDPTILARGRRLLRLDEEFGLFLVSSTTPESFGPTSFH